MLRFVRRNIGIVFSFLGFFLLGIVTFGNIVDVFTTEYWLNVHKNLASIGIMSVVLVFIQTLIKQGISEQALSSGLNTENTKNKYEEHKSIMRMCEEKLIFMPYFLDIRNTRETNRRKKKFLADNRYTSDKALLASGKKKLIKEYNSILTNVRDKDIKWASTEVITDKLGRVETLAEFRKRRLISGITKGFVAMFITALIAQELFGASEVPVWAKFVKFGVYIVMIAATGLMSFLKNYEKGAFGVPNDLDEINTIWREFYKWVVPQSVIDEVEKSNVINEMIAIEMNGGASKEIEVNKEVAEYEQREETTDSGADLQEEPKEIQAV